MKKKTKLAFAMSLRMTADEWSALAKTADAEERSVTAQIRYIVRAWMKAEGILPGEGEW